MEQLLSEKDIQKVGFAGAGEGYQYLDLDMLIMRRVLDIQFRGDAWARGINVGTISI